MKELINAELILANGGVIDGGCIPDPFRRNSQNESARVVRFDDPELDAVDGGILVKPSKWAF